MMLSEVASDRLSVCPRLCQKYNIEWAEWIWALQNLLYNSEDKPQDQLISDSIFWNHETNNQVEVCVFVNYIKKLMAYYGIWYINKHVRTLGFTEAKIAWHHTMFFEITKWDYFFDNFNSISFFNEQFRWNTHLEHSHH